MNTPEEDVNTHDLGRDEWRDAIHHYQVNRLGQVRNKYTGLIRKCDMWQGYSRVRMWDYVGGKKVCKTLRVHRMVAKAFIPNDDPENKTEIDHINHDRSDNRVENLRWVSRLENMRNLRSQVRRENSPEENPED